MEVEYAKKVFINDYTLDEKVSHYGVLNGRTEGENIIITLEHSAFKDKLPKEYFGYEIRYELKP
jgi:hypothetical protein